MVDTPSDYTDGYAGSRREELVDEYRRRGIKTVMVATTCASCGAKGEQPGPEGMVHKTIICPKCTSRE
jgi:predicted Zn-ribbon and HTH transcriptional regulator